MATEQVTTLGLGVDSSGVRNANGDLRDFVKEGKEAEKQAVSLQRAAVATGTAIGAAISRGIGQSLRTVIDLTKEFYKLGISVGEFQDIADKTGASAAGLASLAPSLSVAGVSAESAANSMVRLQSTLAKTDDESKGVGIALRSIGISVEEFKRLKPDEQYRTLAVALEGYADGGKKVATVNAILGRGGAEQLKALKELGSEQQRVNILTQEQIEKADAAADRQSRSIALLKQTASAIATELIDPMTALINVAGEAAKQILGISDASGTLGAAKGVQAFAESAGRAAAEFADYVKQSYVELKALTDFAESFAGISKKLITGDVAGAKKIGADFRARYGLDENGVKIIKEDGKKAADTFASAYDKELNRIKRSSFAANDPRRLDAAKPEIDTSGQVKGGKKAGAEKGQTTDKDILGFSIAELKSVQADVKAAFADAESILEASRNASLLDEKEYYAAKLALLRTSTQAEIDELEKENEAYAAFNAAQKGTEKDRLDNTKRANENRAKISRLLESEAAKEAVLEIQRAQALKQAAASFKEAQLAAQAYYDQVALGHERELQAFAQSNQEQRKNAGRNQIVDRFQGQRDDLERSKALLEFEGKFTDESRRQYQDRIGLLNEYQAKALQEWDSYYQRLQGLEEDAGVGANRALQNYFDDAQKIGRRTEKLVSDGLTGFTDSLTNAVFGDEGASFKQLGMNIAKQLISGVIEQNITAPLAKWLKQGISEAGQSASGEGGFFASAIQALQGYFGGGSGMATNTTGTSLPTSGGRAGGGDVHRGKNYWVGEKGPEVLRMGQSSGSIVPNDVLMGKGGGSGLNVKVNNYAGVNVQTERDSNGDLQIALSKAAERGAKAGYNRVVRDHAQGTGASTAALRQRSGLSGSVGMRKRG